MPSMCHLNTKAWTEKKWVLAHMKFTGRLTKEQLHDLHKRERKSKVHKWREANDYFERYMREKESQCTRQYSCTFKQKKTYRKYRQWKITTGWHTHHEAFQLLRPRWPEPDMEAPGGSLKSRYGSCSRRKEHGTDVVTMLGCEELQHPLTTSSGLLLPREIQCL